MFPVPFLQLFFTGIECFRFRDHAHTHIHNLNFALLIGKSISLAMQLMKGRQHLFAEWNIQFIPLPSIAQIHRSHRRSIQLLSQEFSSAALFQFQKKAFKICIRRKHYCS